MLRVSQQPARECARPGSRGDDARAPLAGDGAAAARARAILGWTRAHAAAFVGALAENVFEAVWTTVLCAPIVSYLDATLDARGGLSAG